MKWSGMLLFILMTAVVGRLAWGLELKKHKVRSESYWGEYKRPPLSNKIIQNIPEELIDYLRQDNLENGWSSVPKPAVVPPQFMSDLKTAINELPIEIAKKINEKTVGVFFVTDLGGSAYTEDVVNEKGQPVAGFVVIDILAMDRKANQWATWKESSPFQTSQDLTIEATIATASDDNRKSAIQYILLHEFGHILSIGRSLTPSWGIDAKELKIDPSMRFFNLAWQIQNGGFVTRFDSSWEDRAKIQYYASSTNKLPGTLALDAYKRLSKTNFATLYAVTNPFDDFAESFANYVHAIRLKKPWNVSVKLKGEHVMVGHCWHDQRCREKKIILEEVLKE